jgi:hypothetical protein
MMRKHWLRYSLVLLLAYGLSLLVLFPASLGYSLLQPSLQGVPLQPRVYGLSGSVWSGRASQLSLKQTPLGRLDWYYRPWWLLLGRVAVHWHLTPEQGGLEGTVLFAKNGVTLNHIQGTVPLETLLPLLPRCPTEMLGQVQLDMERVVIAGGRLQQVAGSVVWKNAQLALPQPVDLGDLRLVFENADEQGIAGRFSDSRGPLEISGDLHLDRNGNYRVDALLKARPEAAPGLVKTIAILGKPDSRGRYRFTQSGRLRR